MRERVGMMTLKAEFLSCYAIEKRICATNVSITFFFLRYQICQISEMLLAETDDMSSSSAAAAPKCRPKC